MTGDKWGNVHTTWNNPLVLTSPKDADRLTNRKTDRLNMPRHTEPSANTALALILRRMMHGCDIRSESTRTISGRSGLHPDILITADDRAPVVIEAEFMPAPEVERDAEERLRLKVAGGRRKIEAAIALRFPTGSFRYEPGRQSPYLSI